MTSESEAHKLCELIDKLRKCRWLPIEPQQGPDLNPDWMEFIFHPATLLRMYSNTFFMLLWFGLPGTVLAPFEFLKEFSYSNRWV